MIPKIDLFGDGDISWKIWGLQLAALALCISYSIFNKQVVLVAFGITAITCLLGKDQYTFCQLFFLLPFTVIFKTSPSSSSFFAYLLLIYASYLIVRRKVGFFAVVPIAFYLLLGMLNKPDLWLKMMSGWILFAYFVKIADAMLVKYVSLSLSLGLIISSLWGLVKFDLPQIAIYMKDDNVENMLGEQIVRFSGLYYDPNYFSVTVIMALFFILNMGASGSLDKRFAYPIAAALIYFGALSYSKIFMLSVILVILSQISNVIKFSKYKALTLASIIIAVAVFIPRFLESDFVANFTYRLQSREISNGRVDLVSLYLNYLYSNFDILSVGVGLGGGLYNGAGPHNTFIEALYFLGLLGSIIYIATIYKILSSRRLVMYRTMKNYTLLFIFCLMIGTLGMLIMNDFMFYFMLLWYSLNIDYEAIDREK